MKLAGIALAVALSAGAVSSVGPQPAPATVLLELFTSEGCSSCPPADAALARLLERPPPGIALLALGEHVDYWDGLGWKDRRSSPAFSARQEAYARSLGLSGPYTPQLVVDGRRQVLGSDEGAARAAISAAARTPLRTVAIRQRDAGPGLVELEVDTGWEPGRRAEVLVALVQDRARSAVARGENAGRTLEHVAVALSLTTLGRGRGAYRGVLRLRPAAGADRAVAFVQEPDGGPVLAAGAVELR